MDGVKLNSTDDGHYLTFNFWDILDYTGKDCNILITPNMTNLTGHIVASDNNYTMDYEFTDEGYTGKCPIRVKYHNIPYYMEVVLHDRHGNHLNTFGKTWGSNGYSGVCPDMIDAKLSLWHKSEFWYTQSVKVAELALNGMNGHSLEVKDRKSVV